MGQVDTTQLIECRVIFGGNGDRVIVLLESDTKIEMKPLIQLLRQQVAELVAEHELQTGEIV